MKKHNFSAGPAILPASVLEEAAQAVKDYQNTGLSLIERSHRGPEFTAIMDETVALVQELLNLDDQYSVVFLTGGASSQFFMVPMNFLQSDESAAYLDTGTWANKAIKEAKLFGKVEVLASSKESNYTFIPKGYEVPDSARYLHLTSNNTVFGGQLHEFPKTSIPIVCDMSSDIFSRPIDIKPFGMIYAGAQKNLGPAGVTLGIIRKDMLREPASPLPTMLRYSTYVDNNSLYNTPPVFPIYVSMLTMRWIKANGGLEGMASRNAAKAELLYTEIDRNPLFRCPVAVEDRSLMNAVFVGEKPELDKAFLDATKAAGCDGLKGHRSVGGFRASMYNAMELESVQVLVDVMQDFARKNG